MNHDDRRALDVLWDHEIHVHLIDGNMPAFSRGRLNDAGELFGRLRDTLAANDQAAAAFQDKRIRSLDDVRHLLCESSICDSKGHQHQRAGEEGGRCGTTLIDSHETLKIGAAVHVTSQL
jgi:hypothetical protein